MIFTPHPYQRYCIDRVVKDQAIGLFLDMGLGKTVITLSAIMELKYGRFAVNKVLVIAPEESSRSDLAAGGFQVGLPPESPVCYSLGQCAESDQGALPAGRYLRDQP